MSKNSNKSIKVLIAKKTKEKRNIGSNKDKILRSFNIISKNLLDLLVIYSYYKGKNLYTQNLCTIDTKKLIYINII